MSDPVVVVRLLAAIEEREQVARAALGSYWHADADEPGPGDGVWTQEDAWVSVPQSGDTVAACTWDDYEHTHMETEHAAHIAANDPASVLRLCQSHRDIVEEWQRSQQIADQLYNELPLGDAYLVAKGIAAGLYSAVFMLARGYGVEED